ncbi:hypothetical protein ACN47E_009725 [Coniothyrium glycines]
MWNLKLLSLLAAAVPVLSTGDSQPDPGPCIANQLRCVDNRVETCHLREHWTMLTECTYGLVCIEENHHASCVDPTLVPAPLSTAPSSTSLPSVFRTIISPSQPSNEISTAEICFKVGEERCVTIDGWVIQECTPGFWWKTKQVCGRDQICSDYGDKGRCTWVDARDLAVENTQPLPIPSTIVRKGTTPLSGPHDAERCAPGTRACDSERRFLFQCGDDGKWKQGKQCFRAGACAMDKEQMLACTGFPFYRYPEGDHRVCETETSCEFVAFLFCAGGGGPEKEAECLENMCSTAECADCDRCTYRPKYGGVKPDVRTLWSPFSIVQGLRH